MRKCIILLWVSFALVGCSGDEGGNHDPDTFRVMFISSIPEDYQEAMKDYIEDTLSPEMEAGLNIEVVLTMANFDRLTIEILDKEVDMFIVDRWLDQALLDPYGLEPLDEFYDQLEERVVDPYVMEDINETAEHLYAIPLLEDSAFHQYTGIAVEGGLVTTVVATSPHHTVAKKLIEEWI
ncbi:hypothetical protein ACS127_02730 [Amphibacillus sp. Q70]|uniref:hypothetical protein n=1 Tax=Amphibacillus sp. Q70 TaxID=3453416 RepID=UPI003F8532F7